MSPESAPPPAHKQKKALLRRRSGKWVVVAAVLLLGIAFVGFRTWQGPRVPAYQIVSRPLVQYVIATGRVISDSRAQLGSEITGVVTERLVREGDHVIAGQVLIRLRADELLARREEALAGLTQLETVRRPQALASLHAAEVQLAQARREFKRRQTLLTSNATTREEKERAEQALAVALATAEQARVDSAALAPGQSEETLLRARLEAAEAALSKTVLRAQFPGVILTRHVEPGDLVQPGDVLLEMARNDDIEVLIPVDERNLGLLQIGQKAICITDSHPLEQFEARVSRIAPAIDSQRGTVDVRLAIQDAPDYLRNDLTVTATLETGRVDKALVVPNDALFNRQGAQASVWRITRGVAQESRVTLGLRGAAMTEVISGLEEGDRISISVDLTEGERVRATAQDTDDEKRDSATRNEMPFNL